MRSTVPQSVVRVRSAAALMDAASDRAVQAAQALTRASDSLLGCDGAEAVNLARVIAELETLQVFLVQAKRAANQQLARRL